MCCSLVFAFPCISMDGRTLWDLIYYCVLYCKHWAEYYTVHIVYLQYIVNQVIKKPAVAFVP